MKDFKGKVAVVTGAASGIGLALATRCANEGMKVVLADVEPAALERAAASLEAGGADVLAVPTDVSRHDSVVALAEKTMTTCGAVHLLCNNAGVETGKGTAFWESSLNDWHWVLGVNLWGVIHGVKAFLPHMIAGGQPGHVVNTASAAGLVPNTAIGIYNVSKAAVTMFSETLYMQLKERGIPIGVTVSFPGGVRTHLNEAERNRPADLGNPPPGPLTRWQEATIRRFTEMNETGMPPETFAGLVFDAVMADRLYLLSHPEYNPAIRQHVENLLGGINPAVQQL